MCSVLEEPVASANTAREGTTESLSTWRGRAFLLARNGVHLKTSFNFQENQNWAPLSLCCTSQREEFNRREKRASRVAIFTINSEDYNSINKFLKKTKLVGDEISLRFLSHAKDSEEGNLLRSSITEECWNKQN